MWEEKFSEPVDEGRYRNTIFKSSHLLGGKNVLKRKNMQTHFYIIDCMPKKNTIFLFLFRYIFSSDHVTLYSTIADIGSCFSSCKR